MQKTIKKLIVMKSILEQLQAAKSAAEEAIERLGTAQIEYDYFEEHTPYPAEAPVEDRITYCDNREALQNTVKYWENKAQKKVIAFGELLGMKVTKEMVSYDRKISSMLGTLNYYYDEVHHRLTRMIDNYNEYNH